MFTYFIGSSVESFFYLNPQVFLQSNTYSSALHPCVHLIQVSKKKDELHKGKERTSNYASMCLCVTSDLFENNKVVLEVVSLVDLVLVSATNKQAGCLLTVSLLFFFVLFFQDELVNMNAVCYYFGPRGNPLIRTDAAHQASSFDQNRLISGVTSAGGSFTCACSPPPGLACSSAPRSVWSSRC